ncbi:MAG: neutral/alkaline non-lysosomal ceramidase N-terminal domain-containing protein [Bacteroidota bacterium]
MKYMFEAGTGKADITAYKKGVGMMGYGRYSQKVRKIESNLFARAFVFRDTISGKKVAFVNAEICFITISIKKGVIGKLQKEYPQLDYDFDNVLLTAQHTHSAPGGYSHYALYNFTIPGFVPEVYRKIVDGITEAIVKADETMKPSNLYIGSGVFEPEIDVAFNRSIKAYNANSDVEKLDEKDNHLAIDREMTLLRIDGIQGDHIGMINWFGVHTTNIGNDLNKISSDNKGYASWYFEKSMSECNLDIIAAFAQRTCGDVTPNFIWEPKRNRIRGKYEDDFESAKYNGKLQFDKAKEIFEQVGAKQCLISTPETIKTGGIDYGLLRVDFSKVQVDNEFTGQAWHGSKPYHAYRTGPACLGVSFFKGAKEGRGISDSLSYIAIFLSASVKFYEYLIALFSSKEKRSKILGKYKIQGRKHIMMEPGERKMFGTGDIKNLFIPSWIDKSIDVFKKHYRSGGLDDSPWTPVVLQLQIIIIGSIAIAGIPAEITTIAGRRLKKTILDILKKRGVTQVIISSYANAYSGYITTYEEYQVQCYEGGHTIFGKWTLAAYQTKFKELALEMLKNETERNLDKGVRPVAFTDEELKKRTYAEN